MKNYLRNRFYLRGTTRLGLFNTILAFIFNRVLVRHTNDTGKVIKWSIKRGTDFPPVCVAPCLRRSAAGRNATGRPKS